MDFKRWFATNCIVNSTNFIGYFSYPDTFARNQKAVYEVNFISFLRSCMGTHAEASRMDKRSASINFNLGK
jgi:hypothetical protein